MEKNILYILIDKTLDPIYGAVQGGHAVAEWLLEHYNIEFNKCACEEQPKWKWNNDYLVYLKVDIEKWKNLLWRFDPSKYQWTWFDEPDLNNKTTAIAIHENSLTDYLKHIIKKEELL